MGIITNFVAPCIMTAIGFGIAFAVYKSGSTAIYDAKIQSVASNGMAYCYLSAWVFARLVSVLNFYPMRYKSRVMRSKSGNLRVNQFIYKLVGEGAGENAVVLADDGDHGRYNRANRSLNHFLENAGGMMLALILCSYVFAASPSDVSHIKLATLVKSVTAPTDSALLSAPSPLRLWSVCSSLSDSKPTASSES